MTSNRNSIRKWLATSATLGAALVAFSAAALAQTPSPGPTGTPVATGTASTATATRVVTGTAVTTGTIVPTIPVPTNVYQAGGTGGFSFADPAFQSVWNRTDSLVSEGRVARTWFWGPGPNSVGLQEQYNQGQNKQRVVQYFDKSRMEINNPAGDRTNAFFVTNGLLTVELISGFIQVGENDFMQYHSACIPMSGDFGDTLAPTYHAFQGVSNTQAGDHNAADRTGQNATDTIDRNGKTGTDASKSSTPGVGFVHFENKHNIPKVFWDFLNSSGPVKNAQGQVVTETLISPWFFASGLPISEPYWAKATIQGQVKDVLIQAYERRALTYVPTNPPGFQVEMANIGQHYFDWRYRNYGYCPAEPVVTPTPPTPAPTGTAVSGTPRPTGTVVATGTPAATGTAATGTPAATSTLPQGGTPGASPTSTLPADQATPSVTATLPQAESSPSPTATLPQSGATPTATP